MEMIVAVFLVGLCLGTNLGLLGAGLLVALRTTSRSAELGASVSWEVPVPAAGEQRRATA